MRPQKTFSCKAKERLQELLAASGSDDERRRIRCVYLRARYGYGAPEIAKMTGLKVQTVRNIHSAYLKDGEDSLKLSGKGGRMRFYLNLEAEAAFLADFAKEAKSSGISASRMHTAYQQLVGRNIALTTVYRLLHRHGWRRFAYRPGLWYPPKKDTVQNAQKSLKSKV